MLDRDQFREEHESGEWDDRPKRIQQLRAEFEAYLEKRVPRSLADVPEWYRNHKGSITTKLRDDSEEDGEGGGDEEDESE